MKKVLIITFIIAVVIFFFLLLSSNKKKEVPTPSPTPSGTPSNGRGTTSTTKNYFINQITTSVPPVTGMSWKDNSLVYSNPNGIFDAGTNTKVVERNIDYISWADSFNAVVKSGNYWYVLDYQNRGLSILNSKFDSPIISDSGKHILDYTGNSILIFSVEDGSRNTKDLQGEINTAQFVPDSDQFVVSLYNQNQTQIRFFNPDFSEIKNKTIEGKYKLLSISTGGKYMAFSKENSLLIKNIDADEEKFELYPKGSKLNAKFVNDNSLIIIETYQDTLGRTLDNIYLTDITGAKNKISDSKPIKNRLNLSVSPTTGDKSKIISFAENDGGIWILSLVPDSFPTYSVDGNLVFSKLDSPGH